MSLRAFIRVSILLACLVLADSYRLLERGSLCAAVARDNIKQLSRLLAHGADVNEPCVTGYTPLTLAIMKQNKSFVDYLLEHGANPNKWGRSEYPLSLALKHEDVEIAHLLLDHGAKPDDRNVLDDVIRDGNREFLLLLLEHQADPSIPFTDGVKPIERAMKLEDKNAVEILKQFGAREP